MHHVQEHSTFCRAPFGRRAYRLKKNSTFCLVPGNVVGFGPFGSIGVETGIAFHIRNSSSISWLGPLTLSLVINHHADILGDWAQTFEFIPIVNADPLLPEFAFVSNN